MIELKVLQAVRLKGRVSPDAVADSVAEDSAAVREAVDAAIGSGYLTAGKTVRLSDEGRSHLQELLSAERSDVNDGVISAAYDDFRQVNADFKQLVSQWQLKDGEPNAHDDDEYDARILGRLADVHERVLPIIGSVTGEIPRLGSYADKLGIALKRVQAGETSWLTRPIVDSYHTVWFELHEELIQACGLTRQSEAEAGHAQ